MPGAPATLYQDPVKLHGPVSTTCLGLPLLGGPGYLA